MSPADLATSFTLSIALPVMPFAAGLAATVAAGGAALSTGGFCSVLFPGLALSDSAACWAVCCGAVWASSGDTEAGINSARLAAKRTGGHVHKQKGEGQHH